MSGRAVDQREEDWKKSWRFSVPTGSGHETPGSTAPQAWTGNEPENAVNRAESG